MKYALMKNFLVATGDDPEQHDAKQTKQQPEARPAPAAKPAPVAPAKPSAKEKLPPTKLQVMEAMNAEKDKAKFAGIYDGAFRFPWNEQDASDLGECYVSGICRFNQWVTIGTKTQLLTAAGEHVADVVKDERTGKVGLRKVTPAEKAMAEAEQAGKVADSASQSP